MIDHKKYTPEIGLPIIVRFDNGVEREAVLCEWSWSYRCTDCTHPLQNSHIPSDDIVSWRYKDELHMLQGRFVENVYERRKTADKILSSVKITWLDRVMFWLKSLQYGRTR